jgi:hypothetical protein
MRKLHPRNLWIAFGVAVAIAAPIIQSVWGIGLSQQAFSAQGDATLRADGPAFSIWGLIYTALVVMAVYQLSPAGRSAPVLRQLSWPATLATLGCAVWIFVSAANSLWGSLVVIAGSAIVLIAGLVRADPTSGLDRALIVWPLQLLGGWLTIAAALNTMLVLTAERWIEPQPYWAMIGIAAIVVITGAVGWRLRSAVYMAPVVWGLAWVFEAERTRDPLAAWGALTGAFVLAALAVLSLVPARALPAPLRRR